jgi:hypothetical protein
MNTETQNQNDLSQLTEEQLEAALMAKRNAKKNEQQKIEKAFQKEKEDFLFASVMKFIALSHELSELKNFTITTANKLYSDMFEIQGKEPKEVNTFSLKTDKFKVTVDRQERFEFTEEAAVHIQAIKDILREKFQDRNKGFYNFLESVLMRNSKGDLDPKLLAKGRKQVNEIGDTALIAEFEKLSNCQRVVGSALYCRAYKIDERGKWQDINVQFSSL